MTLSLLIFAVACTPVNQTAPTQNLSTDLPHGPTLAGQGQVVPTATLLETVTATAIPTPKPVYFDRAGYRQFAIVRSYFPGYLNFIGERNFTEIASTLSPDGKMIAISACWGNMTNKGKCETQISGFLVVIDVDSGELLTEIPLGEGWPGPLAFTADSKSLLFSTSEYKIVLWDLTTQQSVLTLLDRPATGSTYYPEVAAAPDGSSYAAVVEKTLFVWNTSGELLMKAPAYQSAASAALSFSADGARLIVFSPDRAGMDVYDTSDWMILNRMDLAGIRDADISPDGRFLAGINPLDNSAYVWDVVTGERLAELDPGHQADSIYFNPAGDLLIIAGMGNLDHVDGYSTIGTLYETKTWERLDYLYSFSGDGRIAFNLDGSRMAVFSFGSQTIWDLPDKQLLAGLDVVKQFQAALHTGDYAAAAALFMVDDREVDYLAEMGVDSKDLAGSFERLCTSNAIFCQPVKELVLMGYDWDDMVYMVNLTALDGEIFISPLGAQVINIYLSSGPDGQPRVIYPAQD
jgi:hypothetical protein